MSEDLGEPWCPSAAVEIRSGEGSDASVAAPICSRARGATHWTSSKYSTTGGNSKWRDASTGGCHGTES
eukprot:1343065-Pyramimonas_sp.AAC.1